MGKLRDKLEQDLRIRGLADNTCTTYIDRVRDFVRWFGKSPEQATLEDINRYQYHLTKERQVAWATFNLSVYALRFFFCVTLGRDWPVRQIPYQKVGRRLPQVLSQVEVAALLKATDNRKHQAIMMTVYAGGLRLGEVVSLKVADIDSQRMAIRIEQGKGKKDRYVMLSEKLLLTLRDYWRAYRPALWLFEGRHPGQKLHPRSVQHVVKLAARRAEIQKPITVHSLRHSFATHLLENHANIRIVQQLLGHRSLRTTEIYTHVAANFLSETKSPLEDIVI